MEKKSKNIQNLVDNSTSLWYNNHSGIDALLDTGGSLLTFFLSPDTRVEFFVAFYASGQSTLTIVVDISA